MFSFYVTQGSYKGNHIFTNTSLQFDRFNQALKSILLVSLLKLDLHISRKNKKWFRKSFLAMKKEREIGRKIYQCLANFEPN